MKKKMICLVLIIALLLCVPSLISKHFAIKASANLITAIREDNTELAISIINKNPNCVNCLPTMLPWWFQLLMELPEVTYPLQEACVWGRYDIVKCLLDNGADCNLVWKGINGSVSPLMYAVIADNENSEDIILLLLDSGADKTYTDKFGRTAYDYAVEYENEILQELLKQ